MKKAVRMETSHGFLLFGLTRLAADGVARYGWERTLN
jgi:hypothetical protein